MVWALGLGDGGNREAAALVEGLCAVKGFITILGEHYDFRLQGLLSRGQCPGPTRA